MSNSKQPILIGSAWPYANGSLHLGHGAGLIGADVLARYFRNAGHPVALVSGSDAHGTPVVLRAEKEGIEPRELVDRYHEEFVETFKQLGFSYDKYFITEDPFHFEVVQDVFTKLYDKGLIYKKTQSLPYSVDAGRFLADRYVEGECPICHFKEARGDQCDNCGNILDVAQLINPISKLDNKPPEFRETEHFFLKLSAFQDELKEWVAGASNWRPNAKNFTLGLLNKPIPDRAITRDIDWGVPIPLPGFETKRIYVWFEAVIGYLSATKKWAEESGDPDAWKNFWENKDAYHYYVHGKDNIVFHSIIWPSMLMGYEGLHLPDAIASSEYLNLDDKQFSTSRDWAVWLPQMLSKFEPDSIRFWLIYQGPETSDANFTWPDFQKSVNKDLVGVVANFLHRVNSFSYKNFPDGIEKPELDVASVELLANFDTVFDEVGNNIRDMEFRKALEVIIRLADKGNQYLDAKAPWKSIKEDPDAAREALWVSANFGVNLATLLEPFLPFFARKVYAGLGLPETFEWSTKSLDVVKYVSEPLPPVTLIPDEVVAAAEKEL